MYHRFHFGSWFSSYARKSPVCAIVSRSYGELSFRWLIDTDRNIEGMQVIADLHGGNPDDPTAVAEYQEIKDKVLEEVRATYTLFRRSNLRTAREW